MHRAVSSEKFEQTPFFALLEEIEGISKKFESISNKRHRVGTHLLAEFDLKMKVLEIEYKEKVLQALKAAESCRDCLRLWTYAPQSIERKVLNRAKSFLATTSAEDQMHLWLLCPNDMQFLLSPEASLLLDRRKQEIDEADEGITTSEVDEEECF